MSPDPRPGGRPPKRRGLVVAVAAAVAVVLVAAAALAVREFRQRGEDQVSVGGVPVAGPPSSSPSGSASCDGGANGDLRFDTEMTGTDGEQVPYSVSLPADYYTACKTYPVLYALHGRDQSNATFLPEAERLRAGVEAGALRDVVIVTPDSNKDGRWEGVYDTHFIDDLIPHVESTYRVEPGAAQRLLVGWSMGGHGAFRFGVEHPDDFAAVWSVDGAMSREPSSYLEFLDGVKAEQPQIRLVGGDLNGDRVEQVVNLFAQQGVDFPYQRLPLGHDFKLFVEADQQADWATLRWMDSQLGRQL
ncbi:Enterochelin esterase [Quadrisphaera granulorum]|uniref:Acyl-CoA:diacylglycerol acyltransferase n=2 Tax=Quadrisphaera granulorum TaxID=317664 RepID=A0A315ZNU6_9ACTN|nr:enterochelin esterase-like enzyme [Quadrisphaera granulorum]SZE98988.1 Enterochelin esterase [Quadrisphaera granulorum]